MDNEDIEASSLGEKATRLCKEATTMGDLSDRSSRGDEGEPVGENCQVRISNCKIRRMVRGGPSEMIMSRPLNPWIKFGKIMPHMRGEVPGVP